MKSVNLISGMLLLAVLAPAAAAQKAPELNTAMRAEATRTTTNVDPRLRMRVMPESKLWVEGNSTVRRYKCDATRVNGFVTTGSDASAVTIADLQKLVRGVDLTVPVAEMRCGDNTMDGHMRKALKSESSPNITFRLTSHEVTPQGADKATVKMTGRLSIAGKENVISLTGDAVQDASGALRVRGSRELRMTEFDVKPPTLMMGTLKVHDPVVVHFEMVLKP